MWVWVCVCAAVTDRLWLCVFVWLNWGKRETEHRSTPQVGCCMDVDVYPAVASLLMWQMMATQKERTHNEAPRCRWQPGSWGVRQDRKTRGGCQSRCGSQSSLHSCSIYVFICSQAPLSMVWFIDRKAKLCAIHWWCQCQWIICWIHLIQTPLFLEI